MCFNPVFDKKKQFKSYFLIKINDNQLWKELSNSILELKET